MNRKPVIKTFADLQVEILNLKNACEKKEDDLRADGKAILNAFSYGAIQSKLRENLLGNLWKGFSIGYYVYKVYKNLSFRK